MAELIVALDGPNPYLLAADLYNLAGIRWFKIGPQAMVSGQWDKIVAAVDPGPHGEAKLFLDLKLADTRDTCREAVKRFSEAGVAAVSTFTEAATRAAYEASSGTLLSIWRVTRLTDDPKADESQFCGDGVIAPLPDLFGRFRYTSGAKVCAGVRLSLRSGTNSNSHGHVHTATPQQAVMAGATHIVVGRPIWQADDPVKAATEFQQALPTNTRR